MHENDCGKIELTCRDGFYRIKRSPLQLKTALLNIEKALHVTLTNMGWTSAPAYLDDIFVLLKSTVGGIGQVRSVLRLLE